MDGRIPLDSRTVLLGSSIQDILKRTQKVGRKGIDFRLYTVSGGQTPEDMQTVMTTLSSMSNPDDNCKRDKQTTDTLLSEALDKVLISDRVKACKDYYKVNNKGSPNVMRVG
jgi:hypothetical protein